MTTHEEQKQLTLHHKNGVLWRHIRANAIDVAA